MSKIFINEAKKAEIDRAAALRAADDWFSSEIASGYTTSVGDSNITLGLTDSDVTLLTGNFLLAKEADAMNLPIPAVIDAAGDSHALTLGELTTVMLGYGQHRAELSAEYARRKSEV